jgi:hypothetical protein
MSDVNYGKDRAWSDRHLPAIQRIVGPLLLAPAPFQVDATEATDLMVMTARDMRIACRVRRPGFAGPYGNEFTMRSRRYDSGAVTEIEKIAAGFGNWLFYGHARDHTTAEIDHWLLVDLHAWRFHVRNNLAFVRWGEVRNPDQASAFVWFDVDTFPPAPPILVARNEPVFFAGEAVA